MIWASSSTDQARSKLKWNLANNPGLENERWRLHFKGNIKVHRIKIKVRTRFQRVIVDLDDNVLSE